MSLKKKRGFYSTFIDIYIKFSFWEVSILSTPSPFIITLKPITYSLPLLIKTPNSSDLRFVRPLYRLSFVLNMILEVFRVINSFGTYCLRSNFLSSI